MKYIGQGFNQAKERGRNATQFYSKALNSTAAAQLALETSLRRALEREEFVLHYQPQWNAATAEVIGLEALIRWQHPQEGLRGPGQFLHVAERTGLIMPMTEWVLKTACAQNRAWQTQGLKPVPVAVNISGFNFQRKSLTEVVLRVLSETGLEAQYLELEVTETTLGAQLDGAVPALYELRALGVLISVDDFGTGHSSLSRIKRLPLDRLKIDSSFVRDIAVDADDAAIVDTVIAMAQRLRLGVIAEGVETEAQSQFLQAHGCREMQGYLFAPPLLPIEVREVLAGERPRSSAARGAAV